MKTLYRLMLQYGFVLKHDFGAKSFAVSKTSGKWEKTVYISKWNAPYEITIVEGYSNCVSRAESKFNTCKEAAKYLEAEVA